MNPQEGIRNPEQLKEAIEIAGSHPDNYQDIIWAIHKYKWYNWYQNLHIKKDSPADIENTRIFNELERMNPNMHYDIEANITYEIEKLESDND